MKKNQKVNVNVQEVNAVNVQEVNKTQFACNMFDDNYVDAVINRVITIDNSRIEKVNVMTSSRIDFFRKLVMLDTSFNIIAIYDYRYYENNSDRSKSKKLDKYECKYKTCTKDAQRCYSMKCQDEHCSNLKLAVKYVRERTAKQLRDVIKDDLKCKSYLNKKYNKTTYLTVNDYQQLVK